MTTRLLSPYSNYAYAVLTVQALRAPDAVAVTGPGQRDVTYAELDARVNQRAYALASAGVQSGDRVAALLSDPMAIIELYLALAKLGAVTAAMNPYWPDEVLAAVSETTGCRAFVYDMGTAAAVSRVRSLLPQVGNWMHIGGPADGALDLDALTASAPSDPPALGAAAEDPLALFFTSGTTGLPKAVVHTHASATAVAQIWLDIPRSPGGAFATGPIIWGVGFAVIAGPALYGAMRLVLAPAFGPAELLQLAASERVTHISVIPSFFTQLFGDERHRDADLSSLKVIMLGAEPLLPSLLERIRARLPQAAVYSYYGATEAPYSCWTRQDERRGALSVSGRARTGGAVRVVDAGGTRVVGEIGEIQLTGPHLMTGYDGRPEQTAAALRDGWYVGGDLGMIDEAGELTVLGRREDAIRRFGRWALPSEVEDAALALEEIAEAGAVGVPEDADEQQILLAVVPRDGAVVDAESVRARLSAMPEEFRPDVVVMVSELPHANDASGGRGKLLRREIRSRWGSVLAGERREDEMTAIVQTARGPVPVSDLGRVLMHEHIFVLSPEVQQNWPDYPEGWDEERHMALAADRLAEVKANGIDTIVDLTVLGLGRYVPRIAALAERSEVNLIVATGAYVVETLPLYFHFRGPGAPAGGPELMTPLFIKDITEGISGTGVKAAILKCVTDVAGLTRDVERVLRAVAQAHRETGVPITTHAHAGLRRGLDQQRIFAEEGVDLSRVIIGHSGDTDDYFYLEQLIDAGSYLGMDRFGLETVPFDKRVEIVAEMCRRGHVGRMVLSHDTSCFSDLSDPVRRAELYPRWRWTHIPQDVLPALRQRGVSDEQVHQMLVANPQAIFERQGGY